MPDRLIALHLKHWYQYLLPSISDNTTKQVANDPLNGMGASLVTKYLSDISRLTAMDTVRHLEVITVTAVKSYMTIIIRESG